MNNQTCTLANSCYKNDCIINQVCSELYLDNSTSNKYITDSIDDPKSKEDFRLNFPDSTIQNKVQISTAKSLNNTWKKCSEEAVMSPLYFHAADSSYSDVPTIIFDVLKADALHDLESSSCLNQKDTTLNNNEILFVEKKYCNDKSSLNDKDKSSLFCAPVQEIQTSDKCDHNLDKDLVFELDEMLRINQIQEVNCEEKLLPEDIIEVPFGIYEEKMDKFMLKDKYPHYIPCLLDKDKDSPLKQLQINNNFTLKIFDVQNSRSSWHKSSILKDKTHVENITLSSNFKDSEEISDHIAMFKVPFDNNNLPAQSVIWNCKNCEHIFDCRLDLSKHIEETHKKKKKLTIAVESSSSHTELEQKSKWKASFKPVPSPQCKVIKNAETFSCNIANCGAEFFSYKELDDHTKNQNCSGVQILRKRSNSFDVTDAEKKNSKNLVKKIIVDPSSVKNVNDEKLNEPCKKKKHQNPLLYNFKERLIKCGRFDCTVKFSSIENLKHHTDCHDFSNYSARNFKCVLCKKIFNKWANCTVHLWKAHNLDIDLLTCGMCKTYKTNLLGKMSIHQEVHFNDKAYKCKNCGRSFKQNSQLKTHICKKKSIEEQPLWAQKTLCNECNKWFTSYKSYVQHYNAIHLKIKNFSCSQCNYQCYMKIHLTTHMRKHSKQKPYTCDLCGLSVADHNSIRRHRITHFPDRKIKCPLSSCSFSTVNIDVFKKHLLLHRPNQKFSFTCQICTFECSALSEYLKHRSIHEEEFLKNNFPKHFFRNRNSSDSEKVDALNHDGVINAKPKIFDETETKVAKNESFKSKIYNSSSNLKTVECDTEISNFKDLYNSDKRFMKKRKIDENFDFETVLIIE